MTSNCKMVLAELRSLANPHSVEGMARFGISTQNTLGISIYTLRPIAKRLGKSHELAAELWASGIHEARLLAGFVDEPAKVTASQMDAWAGDLDSWDVCDMVCSNLFDQTRFAWAKALQWSKRKPEFVRRAGYVTMAALSVHDKAASDEKFLAFWPAILAGATDERNFVKKAVNWAIRQIGKRNISLNKAAIGWCREIKAIDSKAARWIGADALRELTSPSVRQRLLKKSSR